MLSNILLSFAALASVVSALPASARHRHAALNKRLSIDGAVDSVVAAIPQTSNKKYVFAHHMVGNTYPYQLQDWQDDIIDAYNAGIDAFALNVGTNEWQPDRVKDAYDAAQIVADQAPGFKLFMSFDMAVMPSGSDADAAALRDYITRFYNHPSQLKYEGKSFASTFSGQDSTFGESSAEAGWEAHFKGPLNAGGTPVHFVPAFFVSPERAEAFAPADGCMAWDSGFNVVQLADKDGVIGDGGGLPSGATPSGSTPSVASKFKNALGSLAPDASFLNAFSQVKKTYMAAIAPWFFTHYGSDTYGKNWLYYADENLYATRWETLVTNRDKIDFVEIVTWNDYGESSYIAPIRGAQPNSEAWVDGFDHDAWLTLTAYYAKAFKTGKYPEIVDDQVWLAARTHPKDAQANDPIGRPTNANLVEDAAWVVVAVKEASQVVLSTGPNTSKSYDVKPGVSRLSVPLTVGGWMQATIIRGGQTILDFKPDNYSFTDTPTIYNFNAFVASKSTASNDVAQVKAKGSN